jgi:hypothetical protein
MFSKDEVNDSNVAYLAELQTDKNCEEVNIVDPWVYAAKKKHDPDMPTFQEAMRGDCAEHYI